MECFLTMLRRILVALLCPLLWTTSATAQDVRTTNPDVNVVTLQKARELSNLHQAGTKPYRLQASFETYDYKGVPDGKGIMTEIYVREGLWQRSIKYRDKRTVITFVDGKQRDVSDPDYQTTFPLNHVINDLFEPIPAESSFHGYTFKSTVMKMGTTSLDCVIGSLPYLAAAPGSSDLDFHPGIILATHERAEVATTAPNQVYCVDKDPAIVRIIEGHNGLVFTFNRIVRFGNVYIPGDITMMEKGKMRAHIHVDAIVAADLNEADIPMPPADAGGAVQVSGAVMAGKVLKKVQPYYPEDAKRRHVQGTVVMHGIIGKDGHIRELELVSTPDDSLADSALDTARQWTYSPYLQNGAPVEVNTFITMRYSYR
jgi:TonB family protein